MAASVVRQATQAATPEPSPVVVEVRYLPPRVVRALEDWIKRLIDTNGGFGEVLLEVQEGKIKRIRPTESWLADKL